MRSTEQKIKAGVAAAGAALALALAPAGAAADCTASGSGGISSGGGACQAPAGAKAKLVNGEAIAPASAPARDKAVIAAANKIRNKPYRYGGGHGRWWDTGYDCSGAVSFALHGGDFLDSPLPSGSLMRWEKRGLGKWITVFAHGGHAYAVIAGLRWDTSMTPGNGPGWSKQMRASAGYVARHPAGF